MRKKIFKGLLILILLIAFTALIKIAIPKLPAYLSESGKTEANILIIESWLPDAALKIANTETTRKDYDLILTTGVQSSELDFRMVAMNGYLIFYPGLPKDINEDKENHVIEITAKSKMGGIYCSHFNFFINDSLMADFNADEKPRKYQISWYGSLKDIDSVSVQFTNDMVDDKGDRNLYVKNIIIDNEIIIPYQYNSIFDIGTIGGNDRILNDYVSHPQIVRKKLILSGIDSSKVIAVTGKRTNLNRTLQSALAVKKWLKASKCHVEGINIVSMGIHSRRTLLTYRRVLDKTYNIGIISLPDLWKTDSGNSKILSTLGETLDLIYYWIILLPY